MVVESMQSNQLGSGEGLGFLFLGDSAARGVFLAFYNFIQK